MKLRAATIVGLLVIVVLFAGCFFLAPFILDRKSYQMTVMLRNPDVLKSEGAKELPGGWFDFPDKRVKFEEISKRTWECTDFNKDGKADQRERQYFQIHYQWGKLPERHPHDDLKIRVGNEWISAVRMVTGRVQGFRFDDGDWIKDDSKSDRISH